MKDKRKVLDKKKRKRKTKKKQKTKTKKTKTKKTKTKKKIKTSRIKKSKKKVRKIKKTKIKSGTGRDNNPLYIRQKRLEKLLNEKNVRNILPKNLRIFSWMTPKLVKEFNSIENIENSKIYEMSHPGG
tara:strand:+ start:290 stop:673 length:384 start_codon:yes stop_codon:yes gene_type:complete